METLWCCCFLECRMWVTVFVYTKQRGTSPRNVCKMAAPWNVSLFSSQFVFLTYVLGVAWLGVFGFSAVPVFMFYNIWSTCEVIRSLPANMTVSADQICVDIRQYGTLFKSWLNALSSFLALSSAGLPEPYEMNRKATKCGASGHVITFSINADYADLFPDASSLTVFGKSFI